ncbi:MAG: thioredoxin [Eubacterium sp.]|nr:thioredoxin [Eubacterium sp.]
MSVKQIKEDEFEEEVLKAQGTIVVDFWADWCGPCKMLGPVLEELSEEEKNVKFCGVDVEQAERLAVKYGISNIPCVMVFQNGEAVKRSVGFKPKDALKAELL